MKRSLTSAIAMMAVLAAMAVPAKPGRQTITQSDGTVITVERVGDERFHSFVTTDGLTVMPDSKGDFYYTTPRGMTAVRAHNPGERTSEEASLLKADAAQMTFERVAASRASAKAASKSTPQKAQKPQVPNIGKAKVPVLLLSFKDKDFIDGDNANAVFEEFLNGEGVSVGQYFRDQSNGLYDPQFDVFGPYQLSGNTATYGGNNYWGNDSGVGKMVAEGCINLNSQINFSDYDNDGDGVCDVVIVLYAGCGEASVPANYPNAEDLVWPCQWELSASEYSKSLFQDGVTIDKFAVFNEAYGSTTERKIDGIGTMCHEFSHCLGLPDFYDTNYHYYGMGNWSLMCSGSYNNDGYTPIGYSAYEKAFMNWITIEEGRQNTQYTLPALNQKSADTDVAIKLSSDRDADEYFIFENRRQQGWDEYIPAEGMLITHVDFNQTDWDKNVVNNSATQLMCPVPADNAANSTSESGDLWPGRNNTATQFTDTSRPAATLNSGGTLGKPVTEITRNADGTVSFWVMRGAKSIINSPVLSEANDIASDSFTAIWEHDQAELAESYTLEVRPHTEVQLLMRSEFSQGEGDWTIVENTYGTINPNTEDFVLGSTKRMGTIYSPAVNLDGTQKLTLVVRAASYGSDNSSVCAYVSPDTEVATAPATAKTAVLTEDFATYVFVLDADGDVPNHVYISTVGNKKRFRVQWAEIYSGDASASFSGDATITRVASSTDENGVVTVTGITGNSHTVSGLTPGEKYDFRVKAIAADTENYMDSEWSPRRTVILTASGIADVAGDTDADAPAEYFTIDGIRVDAAGLAPGIYLVRRGNTVSKTVVR